MDDRECVEFLQWCLPLLHMRWPGFRKVRSQVCKRIGRRITELLLPGADAYRRYLGDHPDEWKKLDSLCRVTISRFYRDRCVFDTLDELVIPEIAESARMRGENAVSFWSAGCASGEEAYTLNLLWKRRAEAAGMTVPELRIVGTDSDPRLLERAQNGIYRASSLKDMPESLTEAAFEKRKGGYRLREEFKEGVSFLEHDIRERMPEGPFYLILCRNFVFTYYGESLQFELLGKLTRRLVPGGFFVVGIHESLEDEALHLRHRPCVYQK